jgi:hypothetical protein
MIAKKLPSPWSPLLLILGLVTGKIFSIIISSRPSSLAAATPVIILISQFDPMALAAHWL